MNSSPLQPKGWPGPVRMFHWISAVMIITMLTVGTVMVGVENAGVRFDLYQAHKATGVLVLALSVLRLATRLALAAQGPAVPGPRWQQRAAAGAHLLLYLLLVAVGLSGWLLASATPIPIATSVFGLFDLPALVAQDMETYKLAKAAHGWLTKTLLVLVVLHVLAAVKHHVVDKDNVLRRMVRG